MRSSQTGYGDAHLELLATEALPLHNVTAVVPDV